MNEYPIPHDLNRCHTQKTSPGMISRPLTIGLYCTDGQQVLDQCFVAEYLLYVDLRILSFYLSFVSSVSYFTPVACSQPQWKRCIHTMYTHRPGSRPPVALAVLADPYQRAGSGTCVPGATGTSLVYHLRSFHCPRAPDKRLICTYSLQPSLLTFNNTSSLANSHSSSLTAGAHGYIGE